VASRGKQIEASLSIGVTSFLQAHAQQMAAHESPRTTRLYGRTKDEITLGELERIQL
jgi:hypothetical protein